MEMKHNNRTLPMMLMVTETITTATATCDTKQNKFPIVFAILSYPISKFLPASLGAEQSSILETRPSLCIWLTYKGLLYHSNPFIVTKFTPNL